MPDLATPLAVAVSAGEVGAVKLLLASGSDPSIRDKSGASPLDRAVDHGDAVIAKILLASGADANTLCGLDGGSPPLEQAASQGHVGVVRVLIEAGCDLEKRGNGGYQALTSSIYGGHMEIMDLLLKAGPDVNAVAFDKLTPLLAAAKDCHCEAVVKLVEWRANLDLADEVGYAPIHHVTNRGRNDIYIEHTN